MLVPPESSSAVLTLTRVLSVALRFLRQFRYVGYVPYVACVALDGKWKPRFMLFTEMASFRFASVSFWRSPQSY